MNIGEAVKERILELCREHDISVNKLSSMSGVTQSTVNNIVSGRNNSATVSTIKKLCDGLGITIEEFFNSELFRGLEQEIKLVTPPTASSCSPLAAFSIISIQRLVLCHGFQVRFRITIQYQIRICDRVIVDQIIQL